MLLRNLLDNAVKYTPDGGRIDLRIVGADGERAGPEIVVEDSGPGLPAAERERVLDRFYRAGQPQVPGSGLGLSIVKSIATLHGARVGFGVSPTLGGLQVRMSF